jgi:hypothetical protein
VTRQSKVLAQEIAGRPGSVPGGIQVMRHAKK